jgi:hypothetical protein
MTRPALAAIGAVALAVTAAASARAPLRPSARACLVAWNAPANRADRLRLLARKPLPALQLLPGIVATDTWSNGTSSSRRAAPACLLTFTTRGEIRIVTGVWSAGGVRRWSFGKPVATDERLPANVRLLADGRVTKISR